MSKIFKGWSSVKTFRSKGVIAGVPGGNQDITFEAVMPHRFHMTMAQIEAILIGKTVYMKIGGKWSKTPLPQGINFDFANPQTYASQVGATSNVKFIGADVVDNTPTLVYQYTTTVKGPPQTTVTSKVWVGVADNLPRKVESEPKAGQKTTMTFYDYNATNITIAAPIP